MVAVRRADDRETPVGAASERKPRRAAEDAHGSEPPEEAEERRSEDERKLEELIAAKRERQAALETEYEEYKRVRAHLGELMSHNRDALQQAAKDIEGLEELRHAAGLIRQTIELG